MQLNVVAAALSILLFVPGCRPGENAKGDFVLLPGALTSPSEMLVRGDSLLRDARYDEALSTFQTASNEAFELNHESEFLRAQLFIARTLRQLGEYESARKSLETAFESNPSYLSAHDSLRAAFLSERGRVYVRLADYQKADSLLSEAVRLIHQIAEEPTSLLGMTRQAQGLMYHFQGQYDLALDNYEKSVAILSRAHGSFSYEATIPLNNIANIRMRKGDNEKALEMHGKILSIRTATLRRNHPAIAATYGNMGVTYINMGDYNHALSLHRRAQSIWEDNFSPIHPELAATYTNIGEAQTRLGNYEEAKKSIEKAIKQQLQLFGPSHPRLAFSYESLGETLSLMGYNQRADEALSRAKKIWGKQSTENIPFYWTNLRDLALVRLKQGQKKSAERLLSRALELSSRARHPLAAAIANDYVEFFMVDQSGSEKLIQIQKAIRLNSSSVSSNDPRVNPTIRGALSDPELLRSLLLKADAFLEASGEEWGKVEALSMSLATLDRGSELVDKMRLDLISQGSKVSLVRDASVLYSKAVTTSLALFRLTNERRYIRSAFHYGEARKSRLLLDAMADSDARDFAGISDTLLERERSLRVNVSYLERRLSEMEMSAMPDSQTIVSVRNQLFDQSQAYEALIRVFEVSYPDYYALKHNGNTASIADLRSNVLDEHTALLEYVLEPDSLYIFTLTQDSLANTVVGLRDDLAEVVDSLRWGILRRFGPTYTKYAHLLYTYLIQPVEGLIGKKDIIVVPEGVLNLVPFEALLTRPVAKRLRTAPYENYPYLIRTRSATYSYSATLLNETAVRNRTSPTKDFIGFAPGFGSDITLNKEAKRFLYLNGYDTTRATPLLAPLPGTQDEISGIEYVLNQDQNLFSSLFGNDSELLFGWDASEVSLDKYPLDEYRYVHFATHSFANAEDPRLSGMLLPSRPNSGGRDGVLHTGEVYGLKLNADLVVLSACDTGIGSSAEGLIGLSRGFLYAGAKNLVVSLWPSDDASTKFLMLGLYRNLAKGESIRNALRYAKLDLIRHGGLVSRPYFWSPFIQIGDS